MTTTIDLVNHRISAADRTKKELSGEKQGGLFLEVVGEYVVVQDGVDRWLVLAEDYEEGVADLVGDILGGEFDYAINEEGELEYDTYTQLCQDVRCIYSCIGSPSNIDDVRDLEVTGEVLSEIFQSLGLEESDFVGVKKFCAREDK
jgi:hypothetical protein